ncbi:hypothetical protein Ddc_20113 [Ditylenchus destructor]|nr:hypothetical protein Ddc_20113 [Ditylenchus destructor]
MRTDLYHGHELKSSRSTRMHHVCDDDRRPEQFREDVSEGFRACLGRLEQGEDPRIAVVCEDGATFSGAMAVLMQQMHRAHERSGATVLMPLPRLRPISDQAASIRRRAVRPWPPARFTDAREPNRPPEAMFRSPFVSTQRAKDPIVELGDESDKDAGYGSDLSDETTSIAGSDFGGSTRSLSDSLFIEELPSGAHEPTTEPPPPPGSARSANPAFGARGSGDAGGRFSRGVLRAVDDPKVGLDAGPARPGGVASPAKPYRQRSVVGSADATATQHPPKRDASTSTAATPAAAHQRAEAQAGA